MKSTQIIFLMFQISFIKSNSENCTTGCLRCVNEKCVYCDDSNYILINGFCKLITAGFLDLYYPNCLKINNESKCITCAKSYGLNHEGQCVKLEKIIPKCFNHILVDNKVECIKCKMNTYLSNNQCIKVANKIKNCIFYDENQLCTQCDVKMSLSEDQLSCIIEENTNQDDCKTYTYYDCNQCQQCESENCTEKQVQIKMGFYEDIKDNKKLFEFIDKQDQMGSSFYNYQFCKKIQKQCQTTDEYGNCKSCNEGYYLDGQNCHKHFQSTIENCLLQSSQCLKCNSNFILKDNQCIEIQSFNSYPIQNCMIYKDILVDGKVVCEVCENNLKLSNNICMNQEFAISNCEEYFIENQSTKCQKCSDQQIQYYDHSKCVDKIQFCKKNYFACGNSQNQCNQNCNCQIYCEECEQYYFPTNEQKECKKGDKQNCLIYNQGTDNSCKECENKFYLDNDICFPHKYIENCEIYDKFKQNICTKGIMSYLPINSNFQCQQQNIDHSIQDSYYSFNQKCFEENEESSKQSKPYLNCNLCKKSIPFDFKYKSICIPEEFFTQKIENCEIYSDQECLKCKSKYYYDKIQKKCIQEHLCNNTLIINVSFNQQNKTCEIRDELQNCKLALKISNEYKIKYICLECNENSIQTYNQLQPEVDLSEELEDSNLSKQNFLFQNFPGTLINIVCQNGTIIENCEFYSQDQRCKKCIQGTILQDNQCNQIEILCKRDTKMGLFWKYNLFHICKCPSDERPLLTFQIESISQLEIIDKYPQSTCTNVENLPNCYLIIKYDLGQQTDTKCGACKHGYFPIYSEIYPHIIIDCKEIDYCDKSIQSNFLNYCEKCIQEYTFLVQSDKIENYCYPIGNNTNCQFVDNLKKCKFCQDGYFLQNGNCIQYKIQQCQDQYIQQSYSIDINYKGIKFFSNVNFENGCQNCLSNQKRYIKFNEVILCTDEIKTNFTFIENCLAYQKEISEIFCFQCDKGYQLIDKKCQQTNTNCMIYNSQINYCIKCEEGFYLKENLCEQISIENCIEFDGSKCLKCKPYYLLLELQNNYQECFQMTSFKCQTPSILKFENSYSIECGFCDKFLQKENQISQQLLLTKLDVNCLEYDLTIDIQSSTKQCLKCNEQKFNSNDQYYISQGNCIKRNEIEKCLLYEKLKNDCQKEGCEQGYKYDQNEKICMKIPLIQNCLQYENFYKCQICQQNYYLLSCEQNQSLLCSQNQTNYCQQVNEKNLIQNCILYDKEENCLQCQNSEMKYYLSEINGQKTCIRTDLKNCFEIENSTACKNCPSGYFLMKDNLDLIQCIKNDEINCIFYEENFLDKNDRIKQSGHCQFCNGNYASYNKLSRGECINIQQNQFLQNCQYYKIDIETEQIQCSLCEQDFTLDKNGNCKKPSQLMNNKNQDCKSFITSETKKCTSCNEGFYLDENNKCKSCEEIGLKNAKICIVSENERSIFICNKGYYMNTKGECLQNFYKQLNFINEILIRFIGSFQNILQRQNSSITDLRISNLFRII